MQSEEFDKKVKEAADQHHPAYDEKAWGKMEQLLDKHLPQEKDDRRKFIFFLLLFLLLGGGAWLIATKPWGNNKSVTQLKQEVQTQNPNPEADTKINTPVNKSIKEENGTESELFDSIGKFETKTVGASSDNKNKVVVSEFSKEPGDKAVAIFKVKPKSTNTFGQTNAKVKKQNNKPYINIADSKIQKNTKIENKLQQREPLDLNTKMIVSDPVAANTPVMIVNEPVKDNNVKKTVVDPVVVITPVTIINAPMADKNAVAKDSINADLNKPVSNEVTGKTDEPVAEKPVTKKTQAKKDNSFFFTLSTGADISFAGSDKLGKTKLFAGAGLGYTFKSRVTVRTGFYTGRKIYSALAANYHPPASFYNYYPYLEKVDADCKVYEIPVSVSYNFGNSKKQNWFISTGLSSYLMKSESYDYFYKYTSGGPTLNKKWTIEDENKHYFSVLTLSGGYQRNLSKHLSIMVEPYLKLPMSGVGYGKVKLNSAGLLFSIGFKPFSSPKKQQQ
jgi:hypothetical protein